jgi:hypothetical protein
MQTFEFDTTDFEVAKNDFVKYVYNTHCTCKEACYAYKDVQFSDIKRDSENCNLIYVSGRQDYMASVRNIIALFQHIGLLYKTNDKFYLGDKKFRLSWENIKRSVDDDRAMFWLFRKAIVDCIIKSILEKLGEQANMEVYSVGSVKLDSDYDITLYGSPVYIVFIIDEFQSIIKSLFHQDSSTLFDTNVYGTSFINFDNVPKTGYKQYVCGKKFNYLVETADITQSQFTWALVQYFKTLVRIYSREITDILWHDLVQESVIKKHLLAATDIYDILENSDMDYKSIILSLQSSTNDYDYISMANFYSHDSYYSRGAFMDVVVNSQMCKQKGKGVTLSLDDYIQSIIENLSFFMVHPMAIKYVDRAAHSLVNILELDSSSQFLEASIELAALKNRFGKNQDDMPTFARNVSMNASDVVSILEKILKGYLSTNILQDGDIPILDELRKK